MVSRSYSNLLDLASGDLPNFGRSVKRLPRVMTVPGILSEFDDDTSNSVVSDVPSSVSSQRIIIVANQLPLRAHRRLEGKGWSFSWDEGSLVLQAKDGLSEDLEVVYVGCLMADIDPSEQDDVAQILLENFKCVPAFLSPELRSKDLFKSLPETTIRLSTGLNSVQSEGSVKFVYVFQREYATVDPAFVELVGTDELTTCVGLLIRNKKTGMTSVGHLDSVECVEMGLLQMLSAVLSEENDADLDVHLIGSFDDTNGLFKRVIESDNSETNESHSRDNTLLTLRSIQNLVTNGYSWPLCLRIVEVLQNMSYSFHVQTMCVLNHNTLTGPNGFSCPIIRGFVMNTISGAIIPAIFDRSARGPDEVVRIVRGSLSYGDTTWKGRLLETYDTHKDEFVIAPCKWMPAQSRYVAELLSLPDSQFLLRCSTSPYAESPDFLDTVKRGYAYLLEHPNWRSTFPNGQPRLFKRATNGGWVACNGKHME